MAKVSMLHLATSLLLLLAAPAAEASTGCTHRAWGSKNHYHNCVNVPGTVPSTDNCGSASAYSSALHHIHTSSAVAATSAEATTSTSVSDSAVTPASIASVSSSAIATTVPASSAIVSSSMAAPSSAKFSTSKVASSSAKVTSTKAASSSVAVSTSTKIASSSVKGSSTKAASSFITASNTKTASSSAKAISTSSAAPSASSSAAGDTSSSDINAYLDGHNSNRTIHDANPVTWNQTMADKAQTWANKCVFEHSGGSLGPWGENLSAGTGDYPIASGILGWTNEVSVFNPSDPSAGAALHFTQVVWKATEQIGCAVASCPDMFPGYGAANFYVCEYYPPGNVGGEYAQNVSA